VSDLKHERTFHTGYDLPPLPLDEFLNAVSNLPPCDELIEGILPKNQVMLIAGDPWQGKSLEIQRLGCAFGAGASYHGLRVAKCRALYLTWEGSTEGVKERFAKIVKDLRPEIPPIIKLLNEPMPLNKPLGKDQFYTFLSELKKQYNITIVLIDSFPYTFNGNPRHDEDIQRWWEALQDIAKKLDLTFIIVWELTKLIFSGNSEPEMFSLERLKTAHTTAYKVNTVVAIGELKKVVRGKEKAEWTSIGHRIVILKAKDSKGSFDPLAVTLNRDTLCWNGQRWGWDDINKRYKAEVEAL
jgi:hypothetical protein